MSKMKSPAPLAGGKPGTLRNDSTTRSIADSQAISDPRLRLGTNYCCCAECGRYFGGVAGFERHRVAFTCVDPAYFGLSQDARGYWVRAYLSKPAMPRGGKPELASISPHLAVGRG